MVVGAHTSRDFIVIREERSGDLVLSLKKLELQVWAVGWLFWLVGCATKIWQ